jgi:hypothetical protein
VKLIASILALYMMSLVILPSIDLWSLDECADTYEAEHYPQDSEDDCAPFCVCNCCGVIVILSESSIEETIDNTQVLAKNYMHELTIPQGHNHSIWRPPTHC